MKGDAGRLLDGVGAFGRDAVLAPSRDDALIDRQPAGQFGLIDVPDFQERFEVQRVHELIVAQLTTGRKAFHDSTR